MPFNEPRNVVCLIIPPSGFLLDERVFMSLGILRVAAVLENAGWKVEFVDLSGIKNYREAIADHVAVSEASAFGITATTPQLPAASEIAKTIRSVRASARVILGGPHATLVNAACKRERKIGMEGRAVRAMRQLEALFDVLVAGDGEKAIFAALSFNPPKLINADAADSPYFILPAQLDGFPFPARHLIDIESYHYDIDGEKALSLINQLGCPFACGFCGGRASPFFRKARMRTNSNVVAEMKHLYDKYGVRGFMFYDDELNVNPRMIGLMNLIIETQNKLGVKWKLRGFIKAELFTDEQAKALRQAGFMWILIGFESGSSKILKAINKKASLEENLLSCRLARRHGLKIKVLMSIGHPGESQDTVRDTREFLMAIKPDDFDLTIITPYPGSPYYDLSQPSARKPGFWEYRCPRTHESLYSYEVNYLNVSNYYKGVPGEYRSYVFTDYLSVCELTRLRDSVEKEVRQALGMKLNLPRPSALYEHSMGQTGLLPPSILRHSK